MKVEIWSDVMCPFCYIGKRRFEEAMAVFKHADKVAVIWHSFQLDPDIQPDHGKNLYEYLSERKGISIEESVEMHRYVTQMATDAGLVYHFEKAVVANSFDAHRLIQFANTVGKGDETEERLFRAYFTEGKDISDHKVLIELVADIGFTPGQVKVALDEDIYAYRVKEDIAEAAHLGIRSVPFFVFNRKYAVSGAQPAATFLQVLQQSYTDWQKDNELQILVANGSTCTPGEACN
ncbi:MAG: DsbA family oxidoreductase [Bacteroidetes bacterium]|nr:DsbA family oxidoreductase [Bacteroidota bacterium]